MSSAMQSNPGQSLAGPEQLPPAEAAAGHVSTIAPMVAKSQAAFRRDLPELLKERSGQWVAYHGDTQIGFADSDATLCQQCLARGLTWDQFVVRSIEPEDLPLETDVLLTV